MQTASIGATQGLRQRRATDNRREPQLIAAGNEHTVNRLQCRDILLAAAVFARYVVPPLGLWQEYPKVANVLWELERARVFERLGRRPEAIEAYRFVADVWRNGDPEAQTFVREAREGLARLVRESDR